MLPPRRAARETCYRGFRANGQFARAVRVVVMMSLVVAASFLGTAGLLAAAGGEWRLRPLLRSCRTPAPRARGTSTIAPAASLRRAAHHRQARTSQTCRGGQASSDESTGPGRRGGLPVPTARLVPRPAAGYGDDHAKLQWRQYCLATPHTARPHAPPPNSPPAPTHRTTRSGRTTTPGAGAGASTRTSARAARPNGNHV